MPILYSILSLLLRAYELCLLIWCLMSWLPRTGSAVVETVREFLGTICEPYLSIFRGFIPPMGGIDFSPILAFIVLELVERYILPIIL